MNNLNIYIESNPNPNSLKFVTNIMLVDEGIVKDYPDIQSAEDSPLAKKLFDFNYVKRVFFNTFRFKEEIEPNKPGKNKLK